jgi:predicted dehydrogenase
MKRRKFVIKSISGATGIAVGSAALGWSGCTADNANKKVVLGLIGAGARGRSVAIGTCASNASVELKAVCDVNDLKAGQTIQQVESELGYKPAHVRDMRRVFDDRDIDAVIVATPEHWHALATIRACQAGKDVYVEKNPSNNVWEGRKMVEAARKYRRIVQVGFQNRSAPFGQSARAYIESGQLGQVVHVKSYNLLGGRKWEPQPDTAVPDGLDWDAWLGPAPYRSYNPGIHNMRGRGGWNDFWAFSGGCLADDASHVLDLARKVLGDPGHPKSVYALGGNWAWGSRRETPEFQAITYDYEDFTWTCESGNATNYLRKTPVEIRTSDAKFPVWRQNATRTEIYGNQGMMYLGRHGGGWQVIGPEGKIMAGECGLFPDKDHQNNFIHCIRTRDEPNGNPEQGHLSACLVHLGNTAYRVGNKHLRFDGDLEQFIGNDAASALLRSPYRQGYMVPEEV